MLKRATSLIKTDQPPPEPLDTLEDIASRVHCSKRTIARAVADGLLHPVRFNARLIRFRRSEVDRWIAQAEGCK